MPTTIIIQPLAADGYEAKISEAAPNTNYQDPNPLEIESESGARKYSFVQFWLDTIPAGAVITQAKFGFYCQGRTGDAQLRIYRVIDAWYKDTVTWNTRPINGVTPISQDIDPDTGYEVDITEMVQYWMANPTWNLGLCLVANLCENSYIDIVGSSSDDPDQAPYLEITYSLTSSEELTLQSEADNSEDAYGSQYKVYNFFTLPTTYAFYIVTEIAWKNGTSNAGAAVCGIEIVNADPPTEVYTVLAALCRPKTIAGGNLTIQAVTPVISSPIPGGAVIGVWKLNTLTYPNGGVHRVKNDYPNAKRYKIITPVTNYPNSEAGAWSTLAAAWWCRVKLKGFNVP